MTPAHTSPWSGRSHSELAELARELLMAGHLIDRSGMPHAISRFGREGMTDVAIKEWMAASPVYTKRMQRLLDFEGDTVETIFKGMQWDVGAPHEFLDFRFTVHDDHHGEFHLDHCGALMDVEPMGDEYVQAMCHTIEDPTFDATAVASNPRAQVRPIHRPPRTPADRQPHCAWTVTIVPDAEPLPTPAEAVQLGSTLAAQLPLPGPHPSLPTDDGWNAYDEPLDPDLVTERFSSAALARIATSCGASLLHLNSPGLAAGVTWPVPVVIGCHSCVATWWQAVRGTPLPLDVADQAAMIGAGYATAAALVAPSRAFAEATRAAYGLRRPPHVVHNGRPAPTHAAAGRDGLLAAGRLWDEAKGIALLDRIAPRLGAPIRIAGPLHAPHGGCAEFANLHHLGALSARDMARCIAASGIFVSPARYEPFGLTVLEAAQAGCALVLSDIAPFRELWDDAAHYVAVDDEDGFSVALGRLIADPALRAARGAAARRHAARYTDAATAEGMLALYRQVLARPPARECAA